MGNTCGGCLVTDLKGIDCGNAPKTSLGEFENKSQFVALVKVQAHIRGFLARKKWLNYKQNPEKALTLYPQISLSDITPYQNERVLRIMK